MKSLRSLRTAALGLAALGLGQASASAQAFDAVVDNIIVNQAIQTGTTPLTGQRSTFVRAEIGLTSPPSVPVDLDGIMRVFVGGVEQPYSPIYSMNGPFPAQTPANLSKQKGTLNFMFRPPTASNVVLEIEINPAGPNFVAEGNTANNKSSTAPLQFFERNTPELAYSPIDYRPSGGGPNVPNATLIEPGSGDNFMQGIYPAADFSYHRTDAASKLWTGNLSGSGSALLSSLQVDRQSMVPKPEFLYGWVPGGLPYNGMSFLNSPVSMGNTQTFKFQRTYAHEVGHNVGLSHTSWTIQEYGVDVEHHLNITEDLGVIKATSLRNIMDAGLNTNQAWVRATHYEYFFNHNKFKNISFPDAGGTSSLLVNGTWNVMTGQIELHNVVELPGSEMTIPVADSVAEFDVRAYRNGQLVHDLAIMGATGRDSCSDSGLEIEEIGISILLPVDGLPIDRLEILPRSGVLAESINLQRSSSAPEVSFIAPGPSGDVSGNGKVLVSWAGSDMDGDDLVYYLRFSNDGTNFTPIISGTTATQVEVDLSVMARLRDGQGFFELRASDGLNTTVARSSTLKGSNTFFAQAGANPWVYILTPDDGKNFNFGTTVMFHSSSWDLEDRGMVNSKISWSSDIDGGLGTGRMKALPGLSVGFHTITVTATDSDGMTSTDTTNIEIKPRSLPGTVGGPTVYCTAGMSANGCQASISFTGTPSATAASGFTLDCNSVEGNKDGQFFYGTSGQQANTWGSGTSFQCVMPPTKRGGLQSGNGTVGACDGSFSQDMNARWQAKPAHNPGAGAVVQAQFWYRDPQNTSNQTTSLSDAIQFTVEP